MTAENRRVGRPSKGNRRLLTFRLDVAKADVVRELATAEGFRYVSDYLARMASEHIERSDAGAANGPEAEQTEGNPKMGAGLFGA